MEGDGMTEKLFTLLWFTKTVTVCDIVIIQMEYWRSGLCEREFLSCSQSCFDTFFHNDTSPLESSVTNTIQADHCGCDLWGTELQTFAATLMPTSLSATFFLLDKQCKPSGFLKNIFFQLINTNTIMKLTEFVRKIFMFQTNGPPVHSVFNYILPLLIHRRCVLCCHQDELAQRLSRLRDQVS